MMLATVSINHRGPLECPSCYLDPVIEECAASHRKTQVFDHRLVSLHRAVPISAITFCSGHCGIWPGRGILSLMWCDGTLHRGARTPVPGWLLRRRSRSFLVRSGSRLASMFRVHQRTKRGGEYISSPSRRLVFRLRGLSFRGQTLQFHAFILTGGQLSRASFSRRPSPFSTPTPRP